MNILHMSPYYPSLYANHAGGICMGKEIESLRKNNNVFILTFLASDADKRLVTTNEDKDCYFVKIGKWNRILHVLSSPLFPAYFASRTSMRYALKLIYCIKKHKIEAIHMEYTSMGQYIWLVKKFFPHIKICLVEHDVTIQSYERKIALQTGLLRWYYIWEWRKIRKYEGGYCRSADAVLALNDKDKKLLEQHYDVKNVYVMAPYCGFDDKELAHIVRSGEKEYGNICFLGQMGRKENYMAAYRLINICQKVKRVIPELRVYIIGNQPPKELLNKQNDYITVTGFVDDVDVYLKRAQLGVFPLTLGAGIKSKVLRSMALGIPIVTSKVGAEGIDEDGVVISIAETDEDYIKLIIDIISSPSKCQNLSDESMDYYLNHFAWSRSDKLLNDIYQER